ncbi:MAG: alkaline phosphatase family protein [Candidatus Aminicenantes bacterium]|nr:alkaline phosphatase family protein [Candidatus Aminicenantes bacterium]
MNRKTLCAVPAFLGLLLLAAAPAGAYIGPGAGFAFLSSFLVLFLTFVLAIFSFLSWPFRLLFRILKSGNPYKKSRIDRAVIIGLDGLEPTLVERYMQDGMLPHFSALRKEGGYAPLQTTTPAISPVAWSSFMTGTHPAKHNIFDFLSRDPRTYLPDLSSARIGRPRRVLSLGKYNIPLSKPTIQGLRRSIPFWKILGENGISSTVLRVPITFPPEPFKGHLLSGMCAPDLKGSQGTFSFYTSDPERIRKREGGIAVPVEVKDGAVATFLSGPENTMLKVPEELRLPMTIRLDPDRSSATVAVDGQKIPLRPGVFSPWVRLAFKPGLGVKIRAVCKFLLLRAEPHFEMYVTPLNIDPEKPALPISHPYIYSVYLSKLLGPFITLGEANDTWALNEGVLDERAFLDLTYANHAEWEAMLANAMKKTRRGMIACVFETTDSISHMFLRYLDPKHPALRTGQAKMSEDVIKDLFRRMDGLIGRVRSRLGPRDLLLVMSDHGFKSFRRGVNLNTWLHRHGYLSLKDGKTESEEWFKDVDWERTRAYGLGLGGMYINQKGREHHGTVEPGEETRRLKQELAGRLTGLRDEEKQEIGITRIYDRDELPAGPYKDNGPDLIIGYNIGYRVSWDSVTGKVGGPVFEDNVKAWSGDHCIDPAHVPGVLFSNRPFNALTPAIIDIAPTVLDLFGIPVPSHMDGRPLLADSEEKTSSGHGAAPPHNIKKKKGKK